MSETIVHQRVALAERGENPAVIARMRSGWLVMCDRQPPRRGWCILLSVPVVGDLHELDQAGRAAFLADMATAGEAILRATGAARMNYSILGNTDPALHAHLQPRFADEPDELRKQPLWAIWDRLEMSAFDAERDERLMKAIRLSLRGVATDEHGWTQINSNPKM